jgi:hypothetical protein
MNKSELNGFTDEMMKEALIPVSLIKGVGHFKGWRAGRMGKKSIERQINREGKKLKFADPEFDLSKYRIDRRKELLEVGEEKAKRMVDAGKIKGRGWVAQHKGKLLLGGAAVGALALASSSNDKDKQRRQMLASNRNFKIPRRVYYQ